MTEHCNRGPYEDTFVNRLAQVLRGDVGRGGSAVNFKHQPKDLNASIEQQPQQTKRLPGAQVRSLLGNEP